MAIQKLSQAGAFGSGSELWILPQVEKSVWARKIDWYLNFQISRAKDHTPHRPRPELNEILSQNEQEFVEYTTDESTRPLLVASHSHLPNEMTLELPFHEEPQHWVKQAHTHWDQLRRPTLRVFLPPGMPMDDFIQLWPEPSTSVEITLVSAIASPNP